LAGPSPHRGGIQPGSPQTDRGRASAATCEFNVYWRAVEADLRERDDLDLVEPIYLQMRHLRVGVEVRVNVAAIPRWVIIGYILLLN
jgi:hypothetical protein